MECKYQYTGHGMMLQNILFTATWYINNVEYNTSNYKLISTKISLLTEHFCIHIFGPWPLDHEANVLLQRLHETLIKTLI